MKSRTLLHVALQMALLAALALFAATAAHAGNGFVQRHILFGGSDTDSTEQASDWIPLFAGGAYPNRIIIKTWSTHAAWTVTNSDSTLSDSLVTFKLLFSDSICCRVTGMGGQTILGAADSVVVDAALAANDTNRFVAVRAWPAPINKPLRAPANGTGLITIVAPSLANTVIVSESGNGVIPKRWMRVRCQPLRRSTVKGLTITAGQRVNGLKGFKMIAEVWYENRN